MALQPDGKILAGGDFTKQSGGTQNRLIRLNANNGLKDPTFNIGTGFDGSVFDIIVQPDGKILIGGHYSSYSGSTSNALTRLNTDGSKDTSFNIGVGFGGAIFAIALQPDNNIIAGGAFTSYDGNSQNHLIRLNANGSKDTSFNIGVGFNGDVYKITLQPDNKILVGGTFNWYNGITQNRITRLLGNNVLATDIFVKETIMIYPNPASNYINIKGFEPDDAITIINLNGQIIKSVKTENNRIYISDLDSGVYFIKSKNSYSKFIKK